MTESGQLCGQMHTCGNPQHHIRWTLELGVPLVIVPVCWAHGVQVADLYVIVKTKHIGGEGGGVSSWGKLVSILFLFVVQWVNNCHGDCLVKVLVEFLNALIHFGAWRFTLIPVIHCHRHKFSPLPPLRRRVFLIPLMASESELMYFRWASLIGICHEILGVTIEHWGSLFCAGEVSRHFCSSVSTFISANTVKGPLPPVGSPAAV
jgi:hypothetical protein